MYSWVYVILPKIIFTITIFSMPSNRVTSVLSRNMPFGTLCIVFCSRSDYLTGFILMRHRAHCLYSVHVKYLHVSFWRKPHLQACTASSLHHHPLCMLSICFIALFIEIKSKCTGFKVWLYADINFRGLNVLSVFARVEIRDKSRELQHSRTRSKP